MIFISYSRKNQDLAQRLAVALRKAKHEYWLDTGQLNYGDMWWLQIEKAIKQSRAIALILTTAAAAETSFVRREIAYARMLEKPIFALMPEALPAKEIPFEVADLQQIRCVDDFNQGIQALLATLTPLSQGECEVKDRSGTRQLLTADDRAIISRFSLARWIRIKNEITKGNSGSKVFFVDAAFRNSSSPPTPHFLKIHHAQNDQPRKRHELAYETGINAYMPRLVDVTLWDSDTKRLALLYSLMPTRRFKSLDELLGKNLNQAAKLIGLTCSALYNWYESRAAAEDNDGNYSLPAPSLLIRALSDSLDPNVARRRLEDRKASIRARLYEEFKLRPKVHLIDFEQRRGLPNPLAYLGIEQLWRSEKDLDISYPSGYVHGDLNVRNVLALFDKSGQMKLSLIDFDTYDRDNLIFLDFAFLELAIILRLCSPNHRENQPELERLSEYLAGHVELPGDIPDLNVVSVGIVAILRPIRQTVSRLCDLHPEYDIAFWIGRIAAGLEMSRKTRATYEERVFALLVAADSLDRLIKELELQAPTGDSITIRWTSAKRPSS